MNLITVVKADVVIGAALSVAFVMIYGFFSAWWATEVALNLMTFMGVTALLFVVDVAEITWPWLITHRWFLWLDTIMITGFVATIGWRLALLIRFQIARRFRKSKEESDG